MTELQIFHATDTFVYHVGPSPSRHPSNLRNIWLPSKEDAHKLFDNYVDNISHIHNIVYTPFARKILDDVYEKLLGNQQPPPAHMALMLSILASSARGMPVLFSDQCVATEVALVWTKYVLDILDHSRRTTSPCLEAIQASIILSFLVYNIEGAPARSRSLWSSTLSIARELSLHKVDSVITNCQNMKTRNDIIEHEIKRRVWWFLASSDWFVLLLHAIVRQLTIKQALLFHGRSTRYDVFHTAKAHERQISAERQ